MKRYNLLTNVLMLAIFMILSTFAIAQETAKVKETSDVKTPVQKTSVDPGAIQHSVYFVDKNGDGYNDNAPDHDGDGIPNGIDPDYKNVKKRGGKSGQGFVDNDGDGVNDNLNNNRSKKGRRGRCGFGSKIGNSGVSPQNSTRAKRSANRTPGK